MMVTCIVNLALLAMASVGVVTGRSAPFDPDSTSGCNCPALDYPIPFCAAMPDGSFRDFPSGCEANCAGAYSTFPRECSNYNTDKTNRLCNYQPIQDPVCGRFPDGKLQSFKNFCEAKYDGATVVREGYCHPSESPIPCGCPHKDESVCAKLADGTVKGFRNECVARCAKAVQIERGECTTGRMTRMCGCPVTTGVVCATMPDGYTTTAYNACLANCQGAVSVTDGYC